MSTNLRKEGFDSSRYLARRLVKAMGLIVKSKCKYKITTDSNHRLPVAENELNRAFYPAAPNQVWVRNVTYLLAQEGRVYLELVIELYSRWVVGWSMERRM